MSSLLMTTAVPVRVRYLGIRLSPALREVLQTQAERLASHARSIEGCELHVGNWHLHQDVGSMYRVSLEVELKGGGGKLISTRQSALNAKAEVLPGVLEAAFDESLARLPSKV